MPLNQSFDILHEPFDFLFTVFLYPFLILFNYKNVNSQIFFFYTIWTSMLIFVVIPQTLCPLYILVFFNSVIVLGNLKISNWTFY